MLPAIITFMLSVWCRRWMMGEVWIKFSEDSGIPEKMDAQEFQKLMVLFDATNPDAAWHKALRVLGMDTTPSPSGILKLSGDVPLVNWSHMTRVVSGGSVILEKNAAGEVQFKTHLKLISLWKLFRTHWRVSQYLLPRLEPDAPIPVQDEEKILESLVLGLCILSLTQRLKGANEGSLAIWLQNPEKLPLAMRKTVEQIQAIQKRRTSLSTVWHHMFLSEVQEISSRSAFRETGDVSVTRWKGLGVSGGVVSGKAVVFRSVAEFHAYDRNKKIIAVFPRARPETVEVFPHVLAVLYGDGGTLSHACTVAREQNLSCITALGQEFVVAVSVRADMVLSVEPQNGMVKIAE